MTLTVTYTQAEIDQLKAAIISGVLTITYDGPPRRSVTYQSVDAMKRALADALRTSNSPRRFRLAKVKRGF